MAVIQHSDLTTKQKVWYRFSKFEHVSGPFTVKGLGQGHEGRFVILKSTGNPDRNLLLADDDDFGALLFYDSDPNESQE